MQTMSLSGKKNIFVIVNNYTRYTLLIFLTHKSDAFEAFKRLAKRITMEKNAHVFAIRINRGGEFINESYVEYCKKEIIRHQLLAPRNPQQNGVVERKKKSLVEMSKALNDWDLLHKFWVMAINTACYIFNRCLVRPLLGKIGYKLYHGNICSISHFKEFGSKCYILNTKERLGKFSSKN